MKGILGRKVGMTQVFTNHGEAIAVTVVEIKPNIVTAILTKEKNGYDAIQLGVEDIKKSRQTKPEIGHFKKANTLPKKFVKEIKGKQSDIKIGQTIDISIFSTGELVDVIGISKGKGFAGAIKRHNQSIGPKSHGGGGGSQPQRQTGSLGDISGNKVVKGMTMPGHLGARQTTMQNLEIIAIDTITNSILIKGSIPGPNKSFVVVKSAVKGLSNKEPVELLNLKEAQMKNDLLEEAQKVGADVNTDMTIEEMSSIVKAAKEVKAKEKASTTNTKEVKAKEKASTTNTKEVKAKEKATTTNTKEVKAKEKATSTPIAKATPKSEKKVSEKPAEKKVVKKDSTSKGGK